MTIKQKREALDAIAKTIARCRTCRLHAIGNAVPGEGSADAAVMFVGEAPGKTEASTGRPFVGRSGKLLRSLINEAGLDEKDVFITSALKYLPEHVTPKPKEIEHGRKHLFAQIDVIQPEIIVLLGRHAVHSVLDERIEIAKRHGEIVARDGRRYLIAYHPAAALYANRLRADLKRDFRKLKNMLR